MIEEEDFLNETFLDLGLANKQPVKWIVKNLITDGLTIIGGPPKSGKSTLTAAIAGMVAGLKPQTLPEDLREVPRLGKVFWFSYEANEGELQAMMIDGLGIRVPPDGRIMVAREPWHVQIDNDETVGHVLALFDRYKPLLVIMDPLANMHSLDENVSGDMVRILAPFQVWAKKAGASVVIVHHTSKGQEDNMYFKGRHLRGSGAILGMADGILMYSPRANNGTHIEATFKRATAWERDMILATYGNRRALTRLTKQDKTIARAYKRGITIGSIARQLNVTIEFVKERVKIIKAVRHAKRLR